MITSQIIKNCLEDLCAITHTQFCVQDLNGNIIAATPEAEVPDAVIVSGFANLPVDSQIIGSSFLLKVLDDGEEEGESRQYADAAGSTVWTVMAKGKTTPAKKVKLVDPASSAPVPLIPQVNVPVYRLPEYIEPEEVVEDELEAPADGTDRDVAEATEDETL